MSTRTISTTYGATYTFTGANATLSITPAGSVNAIYGGAVEAYAVVNDGTVGGSTTGPDNAYGIDLQAGGSITNGGSSDTSATINGKSNGILITGGAGTVTNDGGIGADTVQSGSVAIALVDGGQVVNETGGLIEAYTGGIVLGANGAVTNTGTILSTAAFSGAGIDLANGGTVTNVAGGTIRGYDGVVGPTVINTGTIAGVGDAAADGVIASSFVLNGPGGLIQGYQTGVDLTGAGTVVNDGTISGGIYSVDLSVSGGLLKVNVGAVFIGLVEGGGGTLKLAGAAGPGTIGGLGSGTLSGDLSGTFSDFTTYLVGGTGDWTLLGTNSIAGGIAFVDTGMLKNAGQLTGGITLDGGTFENLSGAILQDGGIAVSGSGTFIAAGTLIGGSGAVQLSGSDSLLKIDAGAYFSGRVSGGGGTLKLAGLYGPGSIGGLGSQFVDFGTYLVGKTGDWMLTGPNAIATTATLIDRGTLDNTGSLTGGVVVDGGTLLNDAGASIDAAGVAVTVENGGTLFDAGTIGGGSVAVQLGGSDDLLKVAAGAYFDGLVNGAGGILKLIGTDGPGTFSGLGSGQLYGSLRGSFSDFSAYVIGGTGTWTLTGTNTLGPNTELRVNGTLTVDGGRFEDQSMLAGIGTLAVASYGSVQFDAGVASTTTIAFADATGSVVLDDPAGTGLGFDGVIAGFAGGDQIELRSFAYATGMALDWIQTSSTEGVLTVTEPNGGDAVSLTLSGTFQSSNFVAYSDLNGGTSILDIPASGTAAAQGRVHVRPAAARAIAAVPDHTATLPRPAEPATLFRSAAPASRFPGLDARHPEPAPGGTRLDPGPELRSWTIGIPLGHDG